MEHERVQEILLKYISNFLKCTNKDDLPELLYYTMNEDISIEFDDRRLYLFKDNRNFFIDIDVRTPCEILELLLFLIVEKEMCENIRNSDNHIWFRAYKGNSFLDCQENIIRNELFLSASSVCSAPCLLNYFLRRLSSVNQRDVVYENDYLRCQHRIRSSLKHLLKNLKCSFVTEVPRKR